MCQKKALIRTMKRGILVLCANELIELTRHVDLEKFNLAARSLKEENRILVNDEELENILDMIGKPENNPMLEGAVSKISELLLSFRGKKSK